MPENQSPAGADETPVVPTKEATAAVLNMSRALASIKNGTAPSLAASYHKRAEKTAAGETDHEALNETNVRIYNRSAHSYTHQHPVTGEVFTAPPQNFAMVPSWLAELWGKMFPTELMDSAEATKNANAAGVALEAANKRVADLEGRLAELEKAVEKKKK